MSDKRSEKIAILKAALAKISENKKDIKLTREDIDNGTDKFIAYTNLTLESEQLRQDIGLLSKLHDSSEIAL